MFQLVNLFISSSLYALEKSMEMTKTQYDIEAMESALNRIHYFSHLPRHIKGSVTDLDNAFLAYYGTLDPAHVVDGSVTIVGGRVNIPDINSITATQFS